MTDKRPEAGTTVPRTTLPDNHPVVRHLKNRRTHLESSPMLSDEEKAVAVAAIDEALGILTDAK